MNTKSLENARNLSFFLSFIFPFFHYFLSLPSLCLCIYECGFGVIDEKTNKPQNIIYTMIGIFST